MEDKEEPKEEYGLEQQPAGWLEGAWQEEELADVRVGRSGCGCWSAAERKKRWEMLE